MPLPCSASVSADTLDHQVSRNGRNPSSSVPDNHRHRLAFHWNQIFEHCRRRWEKFKLHSLPRSNKLLWPNKAKVLKLCPETRHSALFPLQGRHQLLWYWTTACSVEFGTRMIFTARRIVYYAKRCNSLSESVCLSVTHWHCV